MKSATLKESRQSEQTTFGFGAKTILFNDEVHTFDEVARQLVKAVGCTYSRGMALANVVHYTGSAIVYTGPVERCEAVAMVLEDIHLKTLVER
jgi:ATP-dependent Clp protease adapter protein ClpS